jgi:hypothetical protein
MTLFRRFQRDSYSQTCQYRPLWFEDLRPRQATGWGRGAPHDTRSPDRAPDPLIARGVPGQRPTCPEKNPDESVVPVLEGDIIFPERIDPGKNQEQRHERNRDERDKAEACRFSHGAVRLTRGFSVRDHLVGEHRVRGERDEEGEDEAGDDCQPDEVHAGMWGSMGNEEGEGAGIH